MEAVGKEKVLSDSVSIGGGGGKVTWKRYAAEAPIQLVRCLNA